MLEPLIVLVDDDDGMRTSLDALMRSLGYRTATFDAADHLLAWDDMGCEDCVISDIQMPGRLDGIGLASELVGSRPDRPVILISAFVDEQVRANAKAAGAFIVIRKPFVGDALVEAVEQALCSRR